MTDLELIIDLHLGGERQGPGSKAQTIRAFDLLDVDQSKRLKIADIGSGSGAQTLDLVEHANAKILAVDLFPEFLKKLDNKAKEKGYLTEIETLQASMDKLPFIGGEFDIIWSEGAIYNMGFEDGIKEWHSFIREEGYLVVSELSWFTNSRPVELTEYWKKAYPEVDTISNKIALLEKHGYAPQAHFCLPSDCWEDNYYGPMKERFETFKAKYENSDQVNDLVATEQEEMAIFERYKEYYGYVFYLAKRL